MTPGYIGAGRVLPIWRGAGIDQKLLLDFGRHLATWEWCHVFPEGGVWQWEGLGGRRELLPGMTCRSSSDFDAVPSLERNEGVAWLYRPREGIRPSRRRTGKTEVGCGEIAHAPITPKVIPFAQVGMERLLPQDEITGKTKLRDNLLHSMLPSFLGGM
ncbi:hypothetical protein HJC23_009118 [Cyclotella cryptica]|uniref:Tafazzin family protein n=1 Tax=Cyclotella cryptica TaxID=29204 RepID=A0ABD3NVG8_9STRA